MNERLARGIARVSLAHEPDFVLGGIQVHPSLRELAGAGWRETIDRRVMQVLVALARAKGKVVSRDDLIESCWEGLIVGEEAINRCISRLRKAAQASGSAFSIETVSRVGYRLKVDEAALPAPSGAAWIPAVDAVISLAAAPTPSATDKAISTRKLPTSICVLPFINMSGDAEQEYFSDGITEDIITDLSKVSALAVVSRNSSFVYKGKNVDLPRVAQDLNVTHVIEGSVRKSGGRVRITAQLIDGVTNEHLWAERYDRDLDDIFALQDEIAEAIVGALRLTLLPEEKQAIERRGTNSLEAYHLYLMARQHAVVGSTGDIAREEALIRLCSRAVEIDPDYARAWALLAYGQMSLQRLFGQKGDGGLAAADRALSLDDDLAEAHAVRGGILANEERHDEASAEIALALRLDPRSWEVVRQAGRIYFLQGRLQEAAAYFETAAALLEADITAPAHAMCCYAGLGDMEGARRVARLALDRSEKIIAQNPGNGNAFSAAIRAHAVLGEELRAREWIGRALLVDSTNMTMRYDIACALAVELKDRDAAIDMLRPVLEKVGRSHLHHVKADPDFDCLRSDSRFQAMMSAAEARITADAAATPVHPP